MRNNLGNKSYPEIIRAFVALFMLIFVILGVFSYYRTRPNEVYLSVTIFITVFIFVAIFIIVYIALLFTNPKIVMEYDDFGVYIYHRSKREVYIKFDDIINVQAFINIWAKPFLIYTHLVITTKDNSVTVRHMDKISDIKDQIKHLAFERDS
jgi:hypothetical protein